MWETAAAAAALQSVSHIDDEWRRAIDVDSMQLDEKADVKQTAPNETAVPWEMTDASRPFSRPLSSADPFSFSSSSSACRRWRRLSCRWGGGVGLETDAFFCDGSRFTCLFLLSSWFKHQVTNNPSTWNSLNDPSWNLENVPVLPKKKMVMKRCQRREAK